VLSGSEDAAVADEAFSVLATLLRERGDEPQALLAELGGQRAIEARGDTVAAKAVSALAARLEEAGQTAQAAERRTRAFALAPDVQGASALLAAATDEAAREATFGQVAEAAAALADAPAARALRMWIVEQRYASESLAAAVELLDAMLATDPDDEEARQMRGAALMSLEGADAASALDRHLAEAIERATEPADRLAAVLQRADVQHARLHNPAAALATLADAVGAAPDDLADSVREAGLALLGTESFDEPAAHATLRDWAVALARRDGATAETRQAAVDHARLVAELRGEADDVDRLVASLLRADRPDDAALELEARAHAAPEEAATRLRAALALWAGDADDVARALGVLDQLRLLPGDHDDDALDEQALALIERLPAAEQAGQLAKLVERASRTTDEPRKARLQAALRRARASTGDADAIAALVTNAPQRDAPADAVDEALQAAQSGGQLGAWVDAVTALVSAPELDEELATALTAKAADIATAELGDPARAAAAWQARWQRSPEDLDAAQMAIAMWRELGETDAVEALLEATAPLQPADEAAPAWLELALLRGTDRGDDAWAALQQAGDVAVIEPRAVTLGVALTAAGTIEDASWLIRAGEQASWVDIEAQCGTALDAAELSAPARATLLDVITHARLGPLHQRDRGVEAAREALATQPTLARWERFMSASKGAVGEVRKALEALAPRADLPLDVARHAAAAADDVGADSLAEPLLRAVVAADVDDDEAFARLDAQLERASRFDELIDTLLARDTALAQRVDAATADDDRETTKLRRAALLHRAGGVALAQGARDLALDAYGRILALFPDDLDAHEGRVEVLRAQADDATLGGALQELAKRLPMGRARSEAFTEAARRVASAGDDEASHALYRAAFEADPANDEAFTMLERAAGEDTRELHKLLRHRAAGVEPGPQQTLVLRKLATVLRAMDRDEEAAATLRKALGDDPTNERVVDELRDLYRELGMVMPLLELVAARLRERATPQRRRALAKQAFDVAMGGGKLPAEARPLLEAIARAADGVDAKRISALFATTAGDARAAARGLEELIEHPESDEKQDELLERLVKLYARELPDDPGIVRTLQRVLRRSPARLDVHRRLAEVYLSRRSFEALLPTVERWAKHTRTDGDRALMLAYRAAAIRGLGRQAEAFELLDEAWALDESQPEVAAQLADAHAARGAYVEAAAMMATAVALWQNREQTNAIPGAAARAAVYFLEAGDEDTALDFADRACAADPDDASARLARGAVYTALDRLDDAFADLQRVAEGTDGSESQRADAFSGMARCAYLRGDTKAARPLIDRALALVPEHHAARELLKALS
jgi:tetratricopeptide (TPR) repeat protein